MALETYQLKDIKDIKVWGRTTSCREPLTLFWTGSALECNVSASELWVEIEADYEQYEPWMGVMINGAYVSRQMLNKGRGWIPLFRGMNPQKVTNVRIVKEVQAMSDDEKHCMQIHALRTDGHFLPVEEKPIKIEFIGDSITSGEGSIGATCEEEWISMWFSAQNTYVQMTAQLLNAEYRIVSQSGWGVYCAWDNNPHGALPPYYDKICGLLKGEKNRKLGAFEAYDFKGWKPNAIVVNLGTNDESAFNSPEWRDPETGAIYKQHRNEDGTYNEVDVERFKQAARSFLMKIRQNNEDAYIIWVYGMLGNPLLQVIGEVIEEYKNESKDLKVELLELPNTTNETIGSRQHPGVLSHRAAAKLLAERLKDVL